MAPPVPPAPSPGASAVQCGGDLPGGPGQDAPTRFCRWRFNEIKTALDHVQTLAASLLTRSAGAVLSAWSAPPAPEPGLENVADGSPKTEHSQPPLLSQTLPPRPTSFLLPATRSPCSSGFVWIRFVMGMSSRYSHSPLIPGPVTVGYTLHD